MSTTSDQSSILENIIIARRSIRGFKQESPTAQQIEKVVRAGVYAPYAAAAVGEREDFRRIFVIAPDSAVRSRLEQILVDHVQTSLKKINSLPARLMGVSRKLEKLSQRLRSFKLPKTPYIIILAELNGIPPVASQALAHTAENMWLMATAEGLGFQLLSVFESMKKNGELCDLLKLRPLEYSFLGCAIGLPSVEQPMEKRSERKKFVEWL